MATLKYKKIRYPNEREAYGIYGYASEQSLKNTINDIHEFLTTDLGLVQTTDAGQLDLANIPDININKIYTDNNTMRFTSWSYGYLIYDYIDRFSSEFPIKLKFEFTVTEIAGGTSSSYQSRPIMGATVSVLSQTDGAGQSTGLVNVKTFQFPGYTNSSNTSDVYEYNETSSYGFNDSVGCRFYVCICPGTKKGTSSSVYAIPMIHFYFERSTNNVNNPTRDYVLFQNFQRGQSNGTSSIQNPTIFFNSSGATYSTVLGSQVPMDGLVDVTNSRKNLFNTINVHPVTHDISYNNNMLSYYNDNMPVSGIITKVKVSDDKTVDYVTVSTTQNQCHVWSTSYSHLIRVGD